MNDDKFSLRRFYLSERNSLTHEKINELSLKITDNLKSLDCYKNAANYLLYSHIKSEVDISSEIENLLSQGKNCFLPKCRTGEIGVMDFFGISDYNLLEIGMYGIKEPSYTEDNRYNPVYADKSADVCIVPGVAFDIYGKRIGYGKGYYDRFLSSFGGVKIGVAYSLCIYDGKIPGSSFDIGCDIIITEKGILNLKDD